MKKIMIFAASAFCFFSCTKTGNDIPVLSGSVASFNVSAPQTKTAIDGVHVLWTDGDAVSLYDSKEYVTTLSEPSSGAVFTGSDASQVGGNYLAVYPSSAVSQWNSSAATVTLPFEQVANAGGFPSGTNLMYAKSSTTDMLFNHAVGYVKLVLDSSSPSDIKCISVISRGSDNLSGKAELDCNGGSLSITDGKPYVIFQNGDESALSAGEYYISIYPGVFASGLTFRFLTDSQYADVDVAGPISISAGQVQSIGIVRNLTFIDFPAVGDVYKEGSVAKGIFFYKNGFEAKVLSLAESTGKMGKDKTVIWNNNASKSGFDNMALLQTLVTTDFATDFPLPSWAVNYGEEGWFVGSNDEVGKLFSEIKNTGFANFNSFLTSNGGTAIQDATYYWSSTAISSDDTKVSCKKFTSTTSVIGSGNYAKDGSRPARAMKNIDFKTDKNI